MKSPSIVILFVFLAGIMSCDIYEDFLSTQETVAELESQVTDLETQVTDLEEEKQQQDTTIIQLQTQIDGLPVAELESQITDIETQLTTLGEEEQQQNTTITQIQTQLADVTMRHTKIIETSVPFADIEMVWYPYPGGLSSYLRISDPDILQERIVEAYRQELIHTVVDNQDTYVWLDAGGFIADGYILLNSNFADTPLRIVITWYEPVP